MIAFKIDTKFEEKLAYASKNWDEEFGKFSPKHLKVSKLGPFGDNLDDNLLSKVENVWDYFYRGVMCHDHEEWC